MAYVCRVGTMGRSSNMDQKVLTWSNSLNRLRSFQVSCLLIHLGTCIQVRTRFRYQRCDICVDLHVIYMLIMAVLNGFAGGFTMFSRSKEKRCECDQLIIIGDIPIRSSPRHAC